MGSHMHPRNRNRTWLATLLLVPAGTLSAACSDAGICRLDSGDPDREQAGTWQVGLKLGSASGARETDVDYRSATLSGAWLVSDLVEFGLDLPYLTVDGPAGDAAGPGDAILRADVRLGDGAWGRWSVQAGARLPTGDDNANPGLPQAYQTGLGPTDLLAGVAWNMAGWSAGIGYLLAGGANDLEGTELERGDDLAIRVGWMHRGERWSVGGDAIAINRLAESSVASTAGRVDVAGSDGMQINLRPSLLWRIHPAVALSILYELPLLERDSDVDGLTRRYGLEVGLTASF
jgi:hypothetical protein